MSDPFNTKGDITNVHTMLIECKECKESLVLKEELKNFWDLETLGIKEKEKSVYEKFIDEITFKENRYEIRLPRKEFHPILEDNYGVAINRLKRTRNRLEQDSACVVAEIRRDI